MRLNKDLDDHLYANRYAYLFIGTLLQVFLVSFFPDTNMALINEVAFSIFMLANINLIRRSKRIIALMAFFAVVILILVWLPDGSQVDHVVFPFEKSIVILFLGVIIYQIFYQILKGREKVGPDVIFGAITIYILFGLIAGESNSWILFHNPEAFAGDIDRTDISGLRYYSYVTMTTLGYGDIAPVSQLARATAVFFSLAGQIYLAVIVALIVGKYVSHSDQHKEEKTK